LRRSRAIHPPAHQRKERERKVRRGVSPVFEQLAAPAIGGAIEQPGVVRAEPREERQVVRADEDVDRIDLHDADAREDAAQVTHRDGARRPRVRKALRRQRDAARLRVRQP
jgi:hypothetical protein